MWFPIFYLDCSDSDKSLLFLYLEQLNTIMQIRFINTEYITGKSLPVLETVSMKVADVHLFSLEAYYSLLVMHGGWRWGDILRLWDQRDGPYRSSKTESKPFGEIAV